jgi:hypothetical protein
MLVKSFTRLRESNRSCSGLTRDREPLLLAVLFSPHCAGEEVQRARKRALQHDCSGLREGFGQLLQD